MAFMDTFKMISSHIAQQEEKVLSLKLNQVDAVFGGLLFPLMRASKEWSILNLNFAKVFGRLDELELFVQASVNGSIGTLSFGSDPDLTPEGVTLDDIKRVWRIAEKFVWYNWSNGSTIEFGGGKEGADTEAEWQRFLEVMFGV